MCCQSLHRIWLLTLYATKMRREELVHLKIGDIDSARMLIHVRQGKGRKDREVVLSPRLLDELRDYWRRANPRPRTYLFPGAAVPRAGVARYTGRDSRTRVLGG